MGISWKEESVAYFDVLSKCLPELTNDNHETPVLLLVLGTESHE